MKVSLNWLREYIDIDQTPEEVANVLTEIGLEVEGMEVIESIKGSLSGLVVGEVLSCEKHPNADRLSLTNVAVGKETALQIVCGAPNVASGQKVVVATIGTTLFDKDGKSWTIKKGKIRGQISEGMLCAKDEIGLGEDHSGIFVLGEDFEVGAPLSSYFPIEKDIVFEVGLTPNRSDATCHLGVAKDLWAALKINYGHKGIVTLPSVDEWAVDEPSARVTVEIQDHKACPRYSGVTISGVQVRESPEWIKKRLNAIGVRPINNIVDITNFVLHELGQPLHAFDLKYIGGHTIKVHFLSEGTSFKTLDGLDRELDQEDLMICDGADQGMCIAGVFGGAHSGVTDETTDIFLESAHFDAKLIRRTSGRHLLFTDASKIFEKGSDPNNCVFALRRAAMMIKDIAGGKISSEIIDQYPQPVLAKTIEMSFSRLNRLVGTEIAREEVLEIIRGLEMEVLEANEDNVKVTIPTNKVDVTREADLIEEVLRIYGFNRVPTSDRMSFSVSHRTAVDESALRNQASDYLYANGFNEIMGLSMIDKKYAETDVFQLQENELVRINNTSNVQVEVMRPDLMITALETIQYNQNRQQTSLRLFEFGKSYGVRAENYFEKRHLSITLTGWYQESWLQSPLKQNQEYFVLKSVVENILEMYGIKKYKMVPLSEDSKLQGLAMKAGKNQIVQFGEVDASITKSMGIRNRVFFADFDWDQILKLQLVDKVQIKEISKFPEVRRDLALIVDKKVAFGSLKSLIISELGSSVKVVNLFDVYVNDDVLGKDKHSYAISILLSDDTKTYSDGEVEKMMAGVIAVLEKETGAQLR
ncbi:UNVERIFIED_CONTAM: hypothetical protein GTU68_047675 [Idotea baltica]|nr:hypothetical protein [Idotea baltica]